MSSSESLHNAQSHHPRIYANYKYIYPVISRRSQGLSLGINLNLDKACNFDCPYCQVNRTGDKLKQNIDVHEIEQELQSFFATLDEKGASGLEKFADIPAKQKILKDIAISGDGEPTMVPEFEAVCALLEKFQNQHHKKDFQLLLITNATLLNRPKVLAGIKHLLSHRGEIWAKLDAGTEEWFQKINVSKISLDQIEQNLIVLGQNFPFVMQSFFCRLEGMTPHEKEIQAYLQRLNRIHASGAKIREVQLYTLARQPSEVFCTPIENDFLEHLCNRINTETALTATVYGIGN